MMRWAIIGIVAILGLVSWMAYAYTRGGEAVQVAEVERGTIREFVDERAATRLPDTILITMPYGGRVQAISWKEGQQVKKGEVLARISPEDLAHEVAQARAVVERLDAALVQNDDVTLESSALKQAELFVESMVATVAAAEKQLEAELGRIDYAEKRLARIKKLVPTGAETEEEMDRAELDRIESQVSYRQADLIVESLRSVQKATAMLPQIVRQYIGRKALNHAVLAKERQEAQARLDQALLRERRGEIRAPADAVVLERAISNEQFLPAGTVLLELGQPDRLEVEAEILSEDVIRIRPGNPVEIYGPALGAAPGDGVPGTVRQVYPAGFTKISSLGVEQQRVRVIIDFNQGVLESVRERFPLGVGYRVRVRIFTREKPQARIVPRSALFRSPDGGWQVFAVRRGRAERCTVEVGLTNDQQAEVVTGLEPGELVVLAPPHTLRHGSRVRPVFD